MATHAQQSHLLNNLKKRPRDKHFLTSQQLINKNKLYNYDLDQLMGSANGVVHGGGAFGEYDDDEDEYEDEDEDEDEEMSDENTIDDDDDENRNGLDDDDEEIRMNMLSKYLQTTQLINEPIEDLRYKLFKQQLAYENAKYGKQVPMMNMSQSFNASATVKPRIKKVSMHNQTLPAPPHQRNIKNAQAAFFYSNGNGNGSNRHTIHEANFFVNPNMGFNAATSTMQQPANGDGEDDDDEDDEEMRYLRHIQQQQQLNAPTDDSVDVATLINEFRSSQQQQQQQQQHKQKVHQQPLYVDQVENEMSNEDMMMMMMLQQQQQQQEQAKQQRMLSKNKVKRGSI